MRGWTNRKEKERNKLSDLSDNITAYFKIILQLVL